MSDILSSITEETLLCGDLTECRGMDIPHLALLASPASSLRRPSFLAEIAWREFKAGKGRDPAEVEAFYLGSGLDFGQDGISMEDNDYSR